MSQNTAPCKYPVFCWRALIEEVFLCFDCVFNVTGFRHNMVRLSFQLLRPLPFLESDIDRMEAREVCAARATSNSISGAVGSLPGCAPRISCARAAVAVLRGGRALARQPASVPGGCRQAILLILAQGGGHAVTPFHMKCEQ